MVSVVLCTKHNEIAYQKLYYTARLYKSAAGYSIMYPKLLTSDIIKSLSLYRNES